MQASRRGHTRLLHHLLRRMTHRATQRRVLRMARMGTGTVRVARRVRGMLSVLDSKQDYKLDEM